MRKRSFAIGRRADAFDDDFVEEVEADLVVLEQAVESLQSIEKSAAELTEAVTTFQDLAVDETRNDQETSEETDMEDSESSEAEEEEEDDSDQQQPE